MRLFRESPASFALLFLLPLQTRLIVWRPFVGTSESEFAPLSIYATACAALIVVTVRLFRRGRSERGLLFALVSVGAAVVITCAFPTAFGAVMTQILSVGVIVSAVYPVLKNHPKEALVALMAGLGASMLLGAWQIVTGASGASTTLGLAARDALHAGDAIFLAGDHRLLRAYGFFPHPNIFGGVLALCGALALAVIAWSPLLVLLVGASILGIGMTLSRGAFLALVLAGIAYGTLGRSIFVHAKMLRPYRRAALLGALMLIPMLVWLFQGQMSLLSFRGEALEVQSRTERSVQLGEWGSVIREHGLLGTGLGGYSDALARMKGGTQPAWAYQPVHNVFLLLFAELGLVGMGVVVGTFVVLSRIFSDAAYGRSIWTHLFRMLRPYTPPPTPIFIALWSLLWFDHFLWTSWAGMVYGALALTFLFIKH